MKAPIWPTTFLVHKGFRGTIEWSENDKCYHGRVLSVKDIVSYEGADEDELVVDFKNAVDSYLSSIN